MSSLTEKEWPSYYVGFSRYFESVEELLLLDSDSLELVTYCRLTSQMRTVCSAVVVCFLCFETIGCSEGMPGAICQDGRWEEL